MTIHEKFDSIKVYSSSKLIHNSINNSINNIEFKLEKLRLGRNNINVVSFFENKNKSKKYSFVVLNDKNPEIYTYKIMLIFKININYFDNDFITQVSKLDKSKTLLIHCASGGRSSAAMNKLKGNDFSIMYNMLGGFSAWEKSGFKVVK